VRGARNHKNWRDGRGKENEENFVPRSTIHDPRSSGFTLIELMVVVALLALTAALVLPKLPASESTNLRRSARALAATLRYLEEQAVTTKTVYRLHLNLTDQSISVTKRLASGDEVPPDDAFFSHKLLADGISLTDVQTERLGTVRSGEVLIDFGSRGLAEFLTVHLQNAAGQAFTVTGFPSSGKVKLMDGYQEVSL
jgi:general secretion pathway protein H